MPMQSIFSLAARRASNTSGGSRRVRAGGLKMDWTKPPVPQPIYGH